MSDNTLTYSAEYLAQDRSILAAAFYVIPIPLEVLSTLFRLWVKASPNSDGHLGWDDFLIVYATIDAVGECLVGLINGLQTGLGRHVQALDPSTVSMFLRGGYIFTHFYGSAIATTKLSILALYFRIFMVSRMRIFIHITAGCVLAWLIGTEIALGLSCQPIEGWWDPSVAATAKCVNLMALSCSTNVLNLIFDIWIFAMPIPVIVKLNVSKAKRIALCCLFSIGLAVCVLSIARLALFFSAGNSDVTWAEVPLGILSALEPCGAILCANLPIIYRPIVNGFKKIGKTARSPENASDDSIELPFQYETPLSPDWTRINSNGLEPAIDFRKTSVTRVEMDESEQQLTTRGGIRVKREFDMESRISTNPSNQSMSV
ncbi:hypothetical protein F5Y10DRAFT_275025 [Nemania abortiva]|nr:hypothetical protein F5Y10DRAFT_275025 [Nemania abortiva]